MRSKCKEQESKAPPSDTEDGAPGPMLSRTESVGHPRSVKSHVKAIVRPHLVMLPYILQYFADLSGRANRYRFKPVELRVVPVHLRKGKDLLCVKALCLFRIL